MEAAHHFWPYERLRLAYEDGEVWDDGIRGDYHRKTFYFAGA